MQIGEDQELVLTRGTTEASEHLEDGDREKRKKKVDVKDGVTDTDSSKIHRSTVSKGSATNHSQTRERAATEDNEGSRGDTTSVERIQDLLVRQKVSQIVSSQVNLAHSSFILDFT